MMILSVPRSYLKVACLLNKSAADIVAHGMRLQHTDVRRRRRKSIAQLQCIHRSSSRFPRKQRCLTISNLTGTSPQKPGNRKDLYDRVPAQRYQPAISKIEDAQPSTLISTCAQPTQDAIAQRPCHRAGSSPVLAKPHNRRFLVPFRNPYWSRRTAFGVRERAWGLCLSVHGRCPWRTAELVMYLAAALFVRCAVM